MISLQDWLQVLQQAGYWAGVPMVVGGLGMAIFGWRMWKVCVMTAWGVIGAMIGARWGDTFNAQVTYAVATGGALGMLSYWVANYAVALIGGLAGAAYTCWILTEWGIPPVGLWSLTIAGGLAGTAYGYLHRRHIVIVTTSMIGSVLLISGLTVWLRSIPDLYNTLRTLAITYAVVVPFVLLVPTTISACIQAAEIHRLRVEE